MPDIPTTVEVVNLATGERRTEAAVMHLLPPAHHLCQVCAVDHEPEQPHNQQSLYYQMAFNGAHGRYPTWHDAMEHCSAEVKNVWLDELRRRGVDI
jgi:hypothetical protein